MKMIQTEERTEAEDKHMKLLAAVHYSILPIDVGQSCHSYKPTQSSWIRIGGTRICKKEDSMVNAHLPNVEHANQFDHHSC